MKSLGVHYGYIKMPWYGCMEHGLEYLSFYVQKTYSTLGGLFWNPAVSRRAARGARISEARLFYFKMSVIV